VWFIALLSPFYRTQGPVLRKSQLNHLKYHLDPAAWVLPGEINAMNNLVHCNYGFTTMPGEVNVLFIALFSPFDCTQELMY
jgi:hypothetical protein